MQKYVINLKSFPMKRIIWAVLVMASSYSAFAQETTTGTAPSTPATTDTKPAGAKKTKEDATMRRAYRAPKFRVGLTVSPLISWIKQESRLIDRGKVRGGVEYGVVMEYFPHPNYGLSTGLTVLYNGGNLIYKDSSINAKILASVNKPATTAKLDVDARFKFQYLTIPLYLKLKTNQIGYFTYFGEFGVLLGFCVEGKMDSHQGDLFIYDNENFLKQHNDTEFRSTIVNFSVHGGGGIEYALSDRVSLLVGLAYNHGFINVVKDGDEKTISLSNVVLKVGILF